MIENVDNDSLVSDDIPPERSPAPAWLALLDVRLALLPARFVSQRPATRHPKPGCSVTNKT